MSFESLKENFIKHEPEILSTAGLIGMVATVGLAIGVTVKAVKEIEKLEVIKKTEGTREGEEKTEVKLDKKELAKTVCKYYAPVVALGGASAYCILRSNKLYASRLVTVAAAYKFSEKNLLELREKTREIFGDKGEKKVNDALAQSRVDANPPDESLVQYTGNGETLCYEALTGRYFKSSKQAIESAINNLNRDALSSMWTSVNDLFDALEIEEVQLGDNEGWDIERGLLDPVFDTALTANGTPVLTLDFLVGPAPKKHMY